METAQLTDASLLLLLPALSILGFIMAAILPSLQKNLIAFLASSLQFITFIIASILLYDVWHTHDIIFTMPWFSLADNTINISIYFNKLSAILSWLLSFISSLVHLYSMAYMKDEKDTGRYYSALGLFTFSMLLIVMSGNLLLIFIGWEGVGFASYLLIGFWRDKPSAAAAASKAFIMNRIGDAGFLIAILIAWTQAGTLELSALNEAGFSPLWQTLIGLGLFAAVLGKSAQFPLLTWLPDAMEGPTPISALIHAATMVAAGIFLLARTFFLLDAFTLEVITYTGLATSLLAALSATQQHDIKKILVYSTISQLGLMVVAIGLGNYSIAILHLFTHAFFKAGLFLSAGNVLKANKYAAKQLHIELDPQNIQYMGALRKALPFTFMAFIITAAALAGMPLLSGFISKEAIFNLALFQQQYLILALLFLISLLTVLYSTKLILRIFFGKNQTEINHQGFLKNIKEPAWIMRLPVLILAACSLWWIVGLNPFSFNQWLVNGLTTTIVPASTLLSYVAIAWLLLSLSLAYLIYSKVSSSQIKLLANNFYLDQIYQFIIIQPVLVLSEISKWIDRELIDRLLHTLAYLQVGIAELSAWFDRNIVDGMVNFSAFVAIQGGVIMRKTGAGKIQLYIALSVLLVFIFLLWILFK
ncbi:MAG TPA: NADH-quinone oxidoreductase subunit L [Cyclobacteriaceae bacterium]|nr:NADH-quinone oxidoreductase subunit L [Cyclobacteriaceae bacterium]